MEILPPEKSHLTICQKCHYEIIDPLNYCPNCGKPLKPPERKRPKRPNGSGTIYKLTGNRSRPWIAKKDGVTIGYYKTKREAVEALGQLAGADINQNYNATFREVYTAWADGRQVSRGYLTAYRRFSSLYNIKFRDLRAADFQRCVDTAAQEIKSVGLLKQLANQLANYAIENGICTVNYAQFIKLPKTERKEKEIFTREEIEKLVADGSEAAKIALCMIFTGLRIGEIFGLTLADYHETYVIGGEKTEAGKNRIIPIAPQARQYFAEFAANCSGPNDKLIKVGFSSYTHKRYADLLNKLEIPYKSPHSCRHTFASLIAQTNINQNVLKKIMGHASITTTYDIYTHQQDDTLIHALDDFEL